MVTKQEVIEHYINATARPGDDAPGICPRAVISALDTMADDEHGIYDLAAEFFGWERRYLSMDEVKESIRASYRRPNRRPAKDTGNLRRRSK